MALYLLHGDLHLRIISARNLPNRDLCSEHLRGCFGSCVSISPTTTNRSHSSSHGEDDRQNHLRDLQHLHHHHKGITSDPYVTLSISGVTVARTSVIHNCEEPEWNENFNIPLAHCASHLEFTVKDNDIIGAQIIGMVTVPASIVMSGDHFDRWLPVVDNSGQVVKIGAELHVSFHFVHVDDNEAYVCGITGDPERHGVEDAYFPLRKGGMVKLYQDAHVNETDLPKINLDGNNIFAHEKCWEDICHSILEARSLIYIVGWSIYVKVRLVREKTRHLPKEGELTLGELLKYKSEEGVRVCMLVWDDKTSHEMLKKAGVMNTHDEETRKFFKHSSVICVLSPRYPSSKLSIIKQQVVGTIYTHHQKCLIVDTTAPEGKRKITAFIGGLDISDGRYDTPEHRLFKDLDSVFSGDVHNPTFDTKEKGPRQPWHDLHCKIEGPAAFDVLTNFEQRWKKATRLKLLNWFKQETYWKDDALLKIDRISWIASPSATCRDSYGDPNVWVSEEDDSDTWHVQVFRSIDSGSVKGFPLYADEAETKSRNLVRGKNIVIDKSIHSAYVKAIRSAKHFIYIENQYFIGSCYGWPSYKSAEADNLIPMELALKIVEKIRKNERFCVYIIIPMWPEGDPKSAAVQEILFWQGQTMMMMYAIIGRELISLGNENAHPEDYLNFYCLGKREISNYISPDIPSDSNNSAVASVRRHRRFMIYVHSKGMIVDDEYVIIGSANINQRSLDGSRDTEIAMGSYQPHHTWASNHTHPHGQVYGYRKSLWAEHLGGLESHVLEEPESLACVKYVNRIATANWVRYTTESNVSLKGHLIKYPVRVEANGSVRSLPGFENFPDVGGKILGAPTALPDELTM